MHENDTNRFGPFMASTRLVNKVVFNSHDAQKRWEQTGLPLPERRYAVHPGNDPEVMKYVAMPRALAGLSSGRALLTRSEMRAKLGLGADEFLLLCIGTVTPHKGQLELLQTVGRLLEQEPERPLRLMLVGFANEDQCRSMYAAMTDAERRSVNDGRLLIVQQPLIFAFYKAADAFVMNTQGSGEVFGRVTIEAMAFGLPVLGTNAGGTTEIVLDGETGLLHPVGASGQELLAEQYRPASCRPRPGQAHG